MVEIGNKPIISHIMNIYSKYNTLILSLRQVINLQKLKDIFGIMILIIIIQKLIQCIKNKKKKNKSDLSIKIIDTGKLNQTGSRLYQLKKYKKSDTFFMTYGDGLSDVNLDSLLKYHNKNKNITMTVVHPPARFVIQT